MPDRDELNIRRQKRDALRKKRELQQRKMRRRLLLAVVVIAFGALALYALTRDMGSQPENSDLDAMMTGAAAAQEKPTRPPDEPTTTIHIKAAGDLNVTDAVVKSGDTPVGYDYTNAFLDVAPLLADADLTVMNFEGNLVGEPYGSLRASAPQQLVDALRSAGVDILQMANSYSIYNGVLGLTQTLDNIRAAGIEPVGAYASNEEFSRSKGYTICDVRGIKVAVVAFTKGMDGLGLPAGNENCVNKLYLDYDTTYQKIDRDGIRKILRNVASEKPDITIAMLHWGAEYNDAIFDTQNSIVSLMKKEGVDIILGTHPHLLRKIDYDSTASTLVAYSLGDFFGDAAKSGTNYSIILDIAITRDNSTGVTRIDGYTYTPIYTLKEDECSNGQRRVVRIDDAIAAYDVNFVDKITAEAKASMESALERIDVRVNGKDEEKEES